MRFRGLLAAALVCATVLLARGSEADSVAPAVASAGVTLGFQKAKLANGLEVILHEDHRTPIVTVNVWYHVGSKDEASGKNGFAHLFEHMMFQGSKHVPEDTYFRNLERVGSTDINGTTSTDRTNYFETIPSGRLELALWLESDRMGFLLDHVDQLTFAGQRDVVKNERRQNYENAPYGLTGMFIREQLFPPGHPYHLLTIGTPKDLDAATLDDVKSFFRTWYVPNNATLVVAGDIDKAKAQAMIEKYFGPIPSGRLPARAALPVAKLAGQTRLAVAAGVELGRVYVSWPTPAYYAPGDGELDLVARVLSGNKTSRLYKRLVYDMQIAQDVSAHQASMQLGSVFEITATAAPGHTPEELLKVIDEELATLRSGGITDAELGRAKTIILSDVIFGLERDGSRADLLNAFNHFTGDPGYLDKDLARYSGATREALKEAAQQYLPETRRVVTIVTPTKGAPLAGRLMNGGEK